MSVYCAATSSTGARGRVRPRATAGGEGSVSGNFGNALPITWVAGGGLGPAPGRVRSSGDGCVGGCDGCVAAGEGGAGEGRGSVGGVAGATRGAGRGSVGGVAGATRGAGASGGVVHSGGAGAGVHSIRTLSASVRALSSGSPAT